VAYNFTVLTRMGLSDPQQAMDTALSGLGHLKPDLAAVNRNAGSPPHHWVSVELRSGLHRDGVLAAVHTRDDVTFAQWIRNLQALPDAPDLSTMDVYWELTLAGADPDTALAVTLAGLLVEQHDGVPWDEMSGFSLTIA
jgi:hypothetical protein